MSTIVHPNPLIAASLRARRATGVLLLAVALLAFAPVGILGPAIGWPASLGKPPAEQLAAVHAARDAVTLGYGVYLLYSVLIAPALIGLAAVSLGGLLRPAAAIAAAFTALSVLARSIGILRWLTVMPALAAAHAAADPGSRGAIELLFLSLTLYGGGIGEVLGVSLFMAAAVGMIGLAALAGGELPRSLAICAVAVAVLLCGLMLPTFGGPKLVPVAVVVTLLSAWMFACGLWCLGLWRRRPASLPAT
ncbi:MAG: DUF4386 family protein [Burkholderiales bacterium]|nr:DUF4386 family protein [Burkholderiales bacterium]